MISKLFRESSSVRNGLSISIWEGALANFQYVALSNTYFVGLCSTFGFTDNQTAIFGSLNFLSQVFFFLNAFIIQNWIDRKRLILLFSTIIRIGWAIPAYLLLENNPQSYRNLFMIYVSLYFVLDKMMAHGWNSWMSDLVPNKIRGKYFGLRSGIVAFVTISFHFIISTVLDYYQGKEDIQTGYAFVLFVSVGMGIISIFLFQKQTHPEIPRRSPSEIFNFKNFISISMKMDDRSNLIGVSLVQMSIGMGVIFFPIYMLDILKVSFTTYAYYQTFHLIIGIIGYKISGYIIDNQGIKYSLLIMISGMIISSIIWIFIDSFILILFILDSIVLGFFQNGFNLINTNVTLSRRSENYGDYRIAFFASIIGLSYFCGSFIAGQLSNIGIIFHLNRIESIKIIFFAILLLRIVSFFYVLRQFSAKTSKAST